MLYESLFRMQNRKEKKQNGKQEKNIKMKNKMLSLFFCCWLFVSLFVVVFWGWGVLLFLLLTVLHHYLKNTCMDYAYKHSHE